MAAAVWGHPIVLHLPPDCFRGQGTAIDAFWMKPRSHVPCPQVEKILLVDQNVEAARLQGIDQSAGESGERSSLHLAKYKRFVRARQLNLYTPKNSALYLYTYIVLYLARLVCPAVGVTYARDLSIQPLGVCRRSVE